VHCPAARDLYWEPLEGTPTHIHSKSFPPRPGDYLRGDILNAWIREQLLQQYFQHHRILCLPL